jgi:hypothetical protein
MIGRRVLVVEENGDRRWVSRRQAVEALRAMTHVYSGRSDGRNCIVARRAVWWWNGERDPAGQCPPGAARS